MASTNGNLTIGERRALKPGAVVSWQHDRMLEEQTGTVESVGTHSVTLYGGQVLCPGDFCRLVSARPTVITGPEVRGLEKPPGVPQDSSEPAGEVEVPPTTRNAPGASVPTLAAVERACLQCGGPLSPLAGAHTRYCPQCAAARMAGRKQSPPKPRSCRLCGEPVGGPRSFYCLECARKRKAEGGRHGAKVEPAAVDTAMAALKAENARLQERIAKLLDESARTKGDAVYGTPDTLEERVRLVIGILQKVIGEGGCACRR